MIGPKSSLADVAFAVCTALDRAGFTVVLTGGSAATFYAPEAYQSKDLDFVITLKGTAGEAALESIGFKRKGQFYVNEGLPFSLDFPPGPLGIGADLITSWNTVQRNREILRVLSPTDSCRDRLASFLFWNDFSGLEQAIAVFQARRNEIDLNKIEEWCRREGHQEKFATFAARLSRVAVRPQGAPSRKVRKPHRRKQR